MEANPWLYSNHNCLTGLICRVLRDDLDSYGGPWIFRLYVKMLMEENNLHICYILLSSWNFQSPWNFHGDNSSRGPLRQIWCCAHFELLHLSVLRWPCMSCLNGARLCFQHTFPLDVWVVFRLLSIGCHYLGRKKIYPTPAINPNSQKFDNNEIGQFNMNGKNRIWYHSSMTLNSTYWGYT